MSQLVVGGIHAHGLLAHRTLIRVARRLVVVGERNDGRTDAQNHGGVNLAVCLVGAVHVLQLRQIARGHGDQTGLFLLAVDQLNETRGQQIVPRELLHTER